MAWNLRRRVATHGVIDIPEGLQWLGVARTEERGERLVRAIRVMNVDAGFALTCAMLLLATHATHARAQEYPARQVRVVAPFPAGGGTDLNVRRVADRLNKLWGQPVAACHRCQRLYQPFWSLVSAPRCHRGSQRACLI